MKDERVGECVPRGNTLCHLAADSHRCYGVFERNESVARNMVVPGRLTLMSLIALLLAMQRCAVADFPEDLSADYVAAIQADWAAQEKRAGRQPGDAESIQTALQRAQLVLDDRLNSESTQAARQATRRRVPRFHTGYPERGVSRPPSALPGRTGYLLPQAPTRADGMRRHPAGAVP